MNHLYFCRHGQSVLGKQGLWAGSTDSPLSEEGRQQAKSAGKDAQDLQIDHIICSPLARARDTAVLIAQEIGYPETKIEVNKYVVERDFGELEGTTWNPEFDLESVASVESTGSILERARITYAHLQTLNAENILIVSHGSFGRALRHIINSEIPFDNHGRFENAEIVELL